MAAPAASRNDSLTRQGMRAPLQVVLCTVFLPLPRQLLVQKFCGKKCLPRSLPPVDGSLSRVKTTMLGRKRQRSLAAHRGRRMLCSFPAASLVAVVALLSLGLVYSAREFKARVNVFSKELTVSEGRAKPNLAKAVSTAPKPIHNISVAVKT